MIADPPKKFVRRIHIMILGKGILAVATLISVVVFLTHRIDQQSREDTRARHELLLREWQRTLSLAVEDYSYWTVAFEIIRDGNDDAVYDHLGSGATESEMFDWMTILAPDGTLLYNFTSDGADSPRPAEFRAWIAKLRSHDPAEYVSVGGVVGSAASASLVSMAWVTPDGLSDADKAALPILIGGRVMNEDALRMVQASTGATKIEIGLHPGADKQDALPLQGPGGTIGWMSWRPRQPGTALRADVLPWIFVICLIVLGLTLAAAIYFKRLAEGLNHAIGMASQDTLTGLLNRAGLEAVLQRADMKRALADGTIALLNIDVDRLKDVNDTHGHTSGDFALQVIARRLQDGLRPSDHIVRLGGDEFLCIVRDSDPHKTATKLATRITSLCEEPIDFGEFQKVLRVSVGIAVGGKGISFETLLKQSDEAMYLAKMIGTVDRGETASSRVA